MTIKTVNKPIITQKLKTCMPTLAEKFNVEKIGLFGSYARNQATTNSDIDLLVEFSAAIGWEFVDLKDYLEDILTCKVNLVTVKALKPQLKDSILKEVIYI